MPKFVYRPEGADPREWEWDPNKMSSKDAELIEAKTGMRFADWITEVQGGSMRALHALLWVLLRKDVPGLQYDEVEFTRSETGWGLTDDELIATVKRLRRIPQADVTPNDLIVLDAYSSQLTADQAAKIDADLEAERATEDETDGQDDDELDPTSPASAPERKPAPAKPAKKKS